MMADSGTYDLPTIQRRQRIAEAMLARESAMPNVKNWAQGLAYLGNVGADAFTLNRLDKQAREAQAADRAALNSVLGSGGTTAPPAVPAVPPASPTDTAAAPKMTVLGGDGNPVSPDANGVYPSDATLMPPGYKAPAPDFGGAISGIESGGKYDALGPVTRTGDRAYGKYGVMGANIPAWTKEHVGQEMTPQQFLASPDAQDAVFKGQFGKYADKYGPEGAARAWFAGEGGMNDLSRKDQLGTSVGDYASKFTAGMGGPEAVARAMSPMAFNGEPSPNAALPPTGAPPPAAPGPSPAAPGPVTPGGPTAAPGVPDETRRRIATLMSASTGSPAYQLGLQLAAETLKPHTFNYQTLPDGTILQLDPTGRQPPKPIYQAPVKPELKETGTDPLTGQKSFAEYNPQAHTFTPMKGATPTAGSDETFNAIAAAKERGASQEELYQQVPISLRNGVKAMIEGKSLPTNLSMRGAARDATMKYAHAIDDTFDEMLIPQRQAFAKSMGSTAISSYGGQVQSAGTIVKHLGGAADAFKTLEGSGVLNETLPALNRAQLAIKGQAGDKKFNDALGRWGVDSEAVAEELSRLLTGGVGAERTKQEWRDKLDIRSQPISKVKAALDEAAQVMMGRLSNVAQAKERAFQTPTDPISLLGPAEQKIMQRLKTGGSAEEPKGGAGAAGNNDPLGIR